MKSWLSLVASAALALGLSCKTAPEAITPDKPEAAAAAKARATKPAVAEDVLDRSVDPCDDFYRFACGGWIKKTPIPPDRAAWTRSFSEIRERNELALRQILEDDAAGKDDPADPYAKKVGDFYATCMDENKAETDSLADLKAELARIDAIADVKELAREVADLHLKGVNVLFSFGSDQDAKDATQVIGSADQGGMGLPDRDYYLKDDPNMKKIRAAYQEHVAEMLALLGEPQAQAQKDAATVLRVETALAKAAMDRVERRDPYKVYHRIERKGLAAVAPHFLWDDYFSASGTPELTAINVVVPEFFKGMDALVSNKRALPDLKAYLRYRTLSEAVPALGKKFVETNFKFTSLLTGAEQILPRWKRCVAMTDSSLGEATGRSFVAKTFGVEGKARSLELLHGIEGAFGANLSTLTWMDDATLQQAFAKLKKIANKIGYPDRFRNYDSMEIGRRSLLRNLETATVFESKRQLAKIGKPVDRSEWQMTPATVNAQYNPALNDISFPAGILQDPFFSADAPDSRNAGGIGMVIGHELTHGFDDQGAQYDGDGNLRDWWTKESSAAFKERAQCVVKQYDAYLAVDDVHLKGALTAGENIADIGGLRMAYLAYKASRADKGPLPESAGFDEDQQVFLGFAQGWCTNMRPEALRLQALTNEHSTAEWRVNGAVSDNAEFAKAFRCKAGSKMAPVNRCTVW
jgi:endothelin-converting enzyme/putative endopeptidase